MVKFFFHQAGIPQTEAVLVSTGSDMAETFERHHGSTTSTTQSRRDRDRSSDDTKRKRNLLAARRSREKKRAYTDTLERQVMVLSDENSRLYAQLRDLQHSLARYKARDTDLQKRSGDGNTVVRAQRCALSGAGGKKRTRSVEDKYLLPTIPAQPAGERERETRTQTAGYGSESFKNSKRRKLDPVVEDAPVVIPCSVMPNSTKEKGLDQLLLAASVLEKAPKYSGAICDIRWKDFGST